MPHILQGVPQSWYTSRNSMIFELFSHFNGWIVEVRYKEYQSIVSIYGMISISRLVGHSVIWKISTLAKNSNKKPFFHFVPIFHNTSTIYYVIINKTRGVRQHILFKSKKVYLL